MQRHVGIRAIKDGILPLLRAFPACCNCLAIVASRDAAQVAKHIGVLVCNRWYPSVLTMPDGNVLVVGGSVVDGLSGYGAGVVNNGNSPTYQYYSPTNGSAILRSALALQYKC